MKPNGLSIDVGAEQFQQRLAEAHEHPEGIEVDSEWLDRGVLALYEHPKGQRIDATGDLEPEPEPDGHEDFEELEGQCLVLVGEQLALLVGRAVLEGLVLLDRGPHRLRRDVALLCP